MDIDDTGDRVTTAAIEHLRDVGFQRLADNLEAAYAALKAEADNLRACVTAADAAVFVATFHGDSYQKRIDYDAARAKVKP